MLQGYSPVMQAFLGTLFTWGLTACGASLVIVIRGSQRKVLDASLGFAAGVMVAASFWSLLSPAIELAENSKMYGENGEYAFAPVALGFILGSLFVYGADVLITVLGVHSPNMMLALHATNKGKSRDGSRRDSTHLPLPDTTAIEGFSDMGGSRVHRRRVGKPVDNKEPTADGTVLSQSYDEECNIEEIQHGRWKRIMLLVIAITVHNIPEGLAVGVGFGATGSSNSANFETARNLAIGIGIQNFPEGLAVSLPLHAAGFSIWKSLWYGQLSGMVEPIFGVLGALAVSLAQPALPYALAFAAGAMIYVVVDDIIPEANADGNGKLATWGAVLGFLVMMTLDVGLG
ncbi:zinc/iron regulated transporter-related protein 48C isoform X1 [Rhynchophorus ferrugineus]|uniref:zinc/iron regulated transporter-related protein 48C isoform X1 n=1 Tax=Rhynchophorus ferrugineus TaxID=354439 RepID=UPI003FCE38B4